MVRETSSCLNPAQNTKLKPQYQGKSEKTDRKPVL